MSLQEDEDGEKVEGKSASQPAECKTTEASAAEAHKILMKEEELKLQAELAKVAKAKELLAGMRFQEQNAKLQVGHFTTAQLMPASGWCIGLDHLACPWITSPSTGR